ncbi:MAG: hypothetical protein PHO10_12095, partial [Gemmiger sp.]|nr:hypothetical protein [Gemmiger sp.]
MRCNLLQKLRQTVSAWPRAGRWLLGGMALLAAIVAGGAITAYGGVLLLLLLWGICMGGLYLLLSTVWRLAFPGQALRQDTPFCIAFGVGAAVGLAVLWGLIFYRQTVYGEDAINYYAKQQLLFGSFSTNGFYGLRLLAENLLAADYKMFINLFVTLPALVLPRTVNGFMVSYSLTCLLPAWFGLLMVAKKLRGWLSLPLPGWRATAYYALCMLAVVLWPMFLWPATHGMPDAFGLVFVAAIVLLTADYRF